MIGIEIYKNKKNNWYIEYLLKRKKELSTLNKLNVEYMQKIILLGMAS